MQDICLYSPMHMSGTYLPYHYMQCIEYTLTTGHGVTALVPQRTCKVTSQLVLELVPM